MKEIVIVYRKYKHAVPQIIMIFNSAALYLTTQPTCTLILLWDWHEHNYISLSLVPRPLGYPLYTTKFIYFDTSKLKLIFVCVTLLMA